jgi:hypothetical protein
MDDDDPKIPQNARERSDADDEGRSDAASDERDDGRR